MSITSWSANGSARARARAPEFRGRGPAAVAAGATQNVTRDVTVTSRCGRAVASLLTCLPDQACQAAPLLGVLLR